MFFLLQTCGGCFCFLTKGSVFVCVFFKLNGVSYTEDFVIRHAMAVSLLQSISPGTGSLSAC